MIDFNLYKFSECEEAFWDKNIKDLDRNFHFLSWDMINYYSAFEKIENKSFLIEIDKKIIAAIPLAINKNNNKKTFGFSNHFCPAPSISRKISNSLRRKIIQIIMKEIYKIGEKKINAINFFSHPILFEKKSTINSSNQFELMNMSETNNVTNILLVDLKKTENDLFNNLSKYHKRNLIKNDKKKIKFNIYNSKNSKKVILSKFNHFKKLHFKSAGRLTRPEKTWQIMLSQIYNNKADLFGLSLDNDLEISYLYCGKINDFAWGWSQVNDDNYEKEYMPRHTLEWKTILYYKNNNFTFYELGERLFPNSKKKITNKEISISDFKEKYGSDIFPRAEFQVKLNTI